MGSIVAGAETVGGTMGFIMDAGGAIAMGFITGGGIEVQVDTALPQKGYGILVVDMGVLMKL
jgi:hypothetical protein